MEYKLNEKARQHVAGHFCNSKIAGSVFNPDIFPDINALMKFLSNLQAVETIDRPNSIGAHIYYTTNIEFIGWDGVGKIHDYPNIKVQTELRSGYETSFIEVTDLPKTNFATIIYKRNSKEYELITAFPGEYAPAFPNEKMLSEEFNAATNFWKHHILLKQL